MGLLEIPGLNTGGHRHDTLGPGIAGGRIVAQRQLFPYIEEQLGIAGAAEDQVCHDHGGDIVSAAAPAHGQLALSDVHLLCQIAGLLRRGHAADGFSLRHHATGQRGKGAAKRTLHPLLPGAAAIKQFHTAGGKQLLIVVEQLMVIDPGRRLLVAQAQYAIGLTGTHFLHQPHVRPILLVVADGANGVDQVLLLALHILRQKTAVAGHGIQKQLTQQVSHRLQQLLPCRSKSVVDNRGYKAHTLALALLADRIIDLRAVQGIQRSGQTLHIRAAHGTAPQHRRQQRVGGGRLLLQRRHQMGAENTGLEFTGRQICQKHILHDLFSMLVHSKPPK